MYIVYLKQHKNIVFYEFYENINQIFIYDLG